MRKIAIYVHGKGGNASEAEHYIPLLDDYEIVGFDYMTSTPWEARDEFRGFFAQYADYDSVILIANSIGAYFSMLALGADFSSWARVDHAFFISPVVDMEKLVCNMMLWANISEGELREKGVIPTSFGETLSWRYLSYVREHPICWNVPTDILYGSEDNMISYSDVRSFAEQTKATLTVMEGGEHWFHTKLQIDFLDNWLKNLLAKKSEFFI
ncbi:MAG: alpha/beta hydrolase [Fibrobacter sp.]|nr:alpha/beta hydrolase [Fibrobacter sp.]